jgi:hypothetical protein
MAATINWTVTDMTCYPEAEGYPDVVFEVYWACSGIQDEYSARVAALNACKIPLPSAAFTPYVDLTKQQVLDWIWANGVDKSAIELQVQDQIDLQITPPVLILPLPWTE